MNYASTTVVPAYKIPPLFSGPVLQFLLIRADDAAIPNALYERLGDFISVWVSS